ncbi:MAG: hypothetical protein ACPHL6_05065 [Rubripirellula sp.]
MEAHVESSCAMVSDWGMVSESGEEAFVSMHAGSTTLLNSGLRRFLVLLTSGLYAVLREGKDVEW